MRYIKLFESFGSNDFKSDIDHIKMIMSDIKDDGIDFRVIPNERAFDDEKDYICIKIYNIPFDLKMSKFEYFDIKYKQLIDEIGDLYYLDKIRVVVNGITLGYKSYDEYYKWSGLQTPYITSLDFELASRDGKEVF